MSETDVATLRRRRGVVHASVTRIATRLRELEGKVHGPSTPSLARWMSQRLEALDTDFKTHHLAVIDAMGDDDTAGLAQEQEILDIYDDTTMKPLLSLTALKLTRACTPGADAGGRVIATRCLSQLETKLSTLNTAIGNLLVILMRFTWSTSIKSSSLTAKGNLETYVPRFCPP